MHVRLGLRPSALASGATFALTSASIFPLAAFAFSFSLTRASGRAARIVIWARDAPGFT